MNRTGQKLKLTSVEELLGVPATESSTEIDIYMIHDFKDHPFKVLDDDKMSELVESIRINGVLSPVLVRQDGEESYEMISGHRRMHAAKIVGLTMIPAIVRDLSDDEAIVYMVDSNIQREELLPSEKAFAYKMKMEAIKRGAGRPTKENSCQSGTNYRADNELSNQVGESARTIQRFIRLTELIPELLDMVDSKRLQFTAGVEISYINKEVQKWICEYIHENGNVNQKQIALLRQELSNGAITQGQLIDILNESATGRIPKKKVTLSEKKLNKYFPPHYSSADMEKVIENLLIQWKEQGGAEHGI